jgi:hypothetical protein
MDTVTLDAVTVLIVGLLYRQALLWFVFFVQRAASSLIFWKNFDPSYTMRIGFRGGFCGAADAFAWIEA